MKELRKRSLDNIREEFPILHQKINGEDLVYLDNAASTQKPKAVINAIRDYYENDHSNVHRGVHTLSVRATEAYENAREKVSQFVNSPNKNQIIFTKGTTESINLIAGSLTNLIEKNDEILITAMEHHSNIVPWQMLCEKTGATMKVIPINNNGTLDIDEYKSMLNPKVKFVFVNHVSNTLGTVNPIKEIIDLAHSNKSQVLVDGAQGAAHLKINLSELDIDFYVTSAHKLCGPTGVGFLYGKESLLNELPPFQGGGEMISDVTFQKTTYADLPHKFEAGTPNISGGIAFGYALDYLNEIGLEDIANYENELLKYCTKKLSEIGDIEIYGNSINKIAVISFNVKGIHAYDIGTLLDKFGIAVRTGQHCAQPVMDHFGISGTVRVSFSFYNTKEEIDKLYDSLNRVLSMLG